VSPRHSQGAIDHPLTFDTSEGRRTGHDAAVSRHRVIGIAVVVVSAAVLAAGCRGAAERAAPAPSAPAPASKTAAPAGAATAPSGGHEHAAPHGGTLVELGEEFAHLELVLDSATGQLSAYALDGEAEKPVRLSAPSLALVVTPADQTGPVAIELAPVENALTGERAGDTSLFRASVPTLMGRTAFTGRVETIAIRGRSFANVAFAFPSTH
jgi:hypothetical protein